MKSALALERMVPSPEPRRRIPFLALLAMGALLAAAPSAAEPASPAAAAFGDGPPSHPFCDQRLIPSPFAVILTPPGQPNPPREFTLAAGPWIGAIVDRGAGPDTSVSTGLYPSEFRGAAGVRLPDVARARVIRVSYADTATVDTPEPHHPLGIEVAQTSVARMMQRRGGFVWVRYVVRNISAEWQPPGWDLRNLYFGIAADPDIGVTDLDFWSDDQAAFVPLPRFSNTGSEARPSGLAYMFDEPGGGDDVDTQVGLVQLGRPVHAFRVWSGGAQDPTSDRLRYFFLRGDSDTEPTIDPPTTRPNDYRILLSVGPVPVVEPGESVRFTVVLRCGDLVPRAGLAERDLAGVGPASPFGERFVVAPNPVRLGGAGAPEAVRFLSLPDGARVQIYSAAGRLVRALDPQDAAATWDLRTSGGSAVAAGIYFYRIEGTRGDATLGKLVVIR